MLCEDLDVRVCIHVSSIINAFTVGKHDNVVCSYGILMLPAKAPFPHF